MQPKREQPAQQFKRCDPPTWGDADQETCRNCGQQVAPLPARFSAIFHTCTKIRRVGKQKVQKVPIFGEHVTLAYRSE